MRSRVDALEKDIEVMIFEDLSPQAQSRALAEFARATLVEAQEKNQAVLGRPAEVERLVDGRRGASEDSVRPQGTITYEFELATELLLWIDLQLKTHSPVKSGHYRDSHRVFVDGTEVNTLSLAGLHGEEIVFLNVQPYARKIERGESSQRPDGVYQVVAELAKARFGNVARISFAYRAPIGGSTPLDAWEHSTGQRRAGRKVAVTHWNRRQPAIIVSLR